MFANWNKSNTFALGQSIVGTPHFMSPEVLNKKRYDYKTDVW